MEITDGENDSWNTGSSLQKESSIGSPKITNHNLTVTDGSTAGKSGRKEGNQQTASEEIRHSEQDIPKLKSGKIDEIMELRSRIGNMIASIRHIQITCNKHEKESQYLKDYISNVMGSQDMR